MNLPLKTTSAFFAFTLLAACDPGNDIEAPPATFAYSKNFDQSRLSESTPIPFRTYAAAKPGEGQTGEEIRGARCELTSKEFHTSFVTPAKVALPVIKGKPSVMKVTCAAGDQKITRYQAPFKDHTVFVSNDLLTAAVATIVSVGVTEAVDKWHYFSGEPTIRFVME